MQLDSEPRWQPLQYFENKPEYLPTGLWPWLSEPGLMTQRLRRCSQDQLHLRVLFQGWQVPRASERNVLGLAENTLALIRETELCCQNEVWIYARSVIPSESLSGANQILGGLGTSPIGDELAKDPNLKRRCFEVAQLEADDQDYEAAVRCLKTPPATLWARRTLVYLREKPLLINEVFLPVVYAQS